MIFLDPVQIFTKIEIDVNKISNPVKSKAFRQFLVIFSDEALSSEDDIEWPK